MGNMMEPDSPPPTPVYEPQFDPMLGFPNGRKLRNPEISTPITKNNLLLSSRENQGQIAIKTTKEEMESAAVPPEMRDYCIDSYMKFLNCRQDNFPLNYRCKHEIHEYHQCQYDDLVIRMKEYERERRLKKLAAKKDSENVE